MFFEVLVVLLGKVGRCDVFTSFNCFVGKGRGEARRVSKF